MTYYIDVFLKQEPVIIDNKTATITIHIIINQINQKMINNGANQAKSLDDPSISLIISTRPYFELNIDTVTVIHKRSND